MREFDSTGLLMCNLQAEAFEKSVDSVDTSSEIFVRRFMNSDIAKLIDSGGILMTNYRSDDLLEQVEEQYGKSNYGSVKYSRDEMYRIGYIYRYYSYTYEQSSAKIYKILKPKELRGLYGPYHTLDPSQAIERILEAKGEIRTEEEELKRQYAILCDVRNAYNVKKRGKNVI